MLAARYADEVRALLLARLRICCWLAVILVPVFIGVDSVLHPQLVGRFLAIRAAMTATSLLVLAAVRTEFGARHVLALSFVNFVETGLGIVLMTAFNGGGSSPYYAGLNLVMLAAAVLMPWEVTTSVSCCLTLIAAYAATCLVWSGIPDPRVFIANIFFLVSTGIITVVSHLVAAGARRREFVQRIALEEAGQHRDHFLANVTHELRTPLAAILGFCEMLADYMPDATDEQRTWLARIRDNACTLYRLIVQILDFSKIEAGAMDLARERFRLDTIVEKVAGDMRAIGAADGAEVAVEIVVSSATVIGDAARVEEIVTNLASNALKFSAGRPILLRVAAGALRSEPAWDRIVPDPGPHGDTKEYLEVAVSDRGDGIAPDDLRRLFVAFQQLDGSSTRRHGGTGLGFAISARLAAAMGAHIAVRSGRGAGSTFALLFPACDDAAVAAEDDIPAASDDCPGQPALAVLAAGRSGIIRSSGPP